MAINLRQLLLDRAARGIGTGGGLMGTQTNAGLLGSMNPNLLLGASIFGAGLQGRDPFSSILPAVTQTAQTTNVLGQLDRQRKTKEFIDKYKKDLPEGSTLKTLFEINPDKALDYISKSELAKLNASNQRTTAVKNALAIGLVPNTKEFNDFVKAQTVKTDTFAQSLQNSGVLVGKGDRDKVVKDLSYVTQIRGQIDVLKQKIDEDPTLSGGIGSLRRGGNKIGTLLKDIGINVEQILPEGLSKDFIFDSDIPTISALENTLAAGYAKVLYPGQKITNQQINQARQIVNLTGLTGSDEVKQRLDQIGREMDVFISSNKALLGEEIKKFRINPNTGKLEEY
tara:strand:+ start:71 stop:1090 length:1020 start_codon:yes stop_codon:yes gene_type:complete